MKFYKSPLFWMSVLYFLTGLVLNIRMYVMEAWPVYDFFVLMGIGLVFSLFDISIRKDRKLVKREKLYAQSVITILLIAVPLLIICST